MVLCTASMDPEPSTLLGAPPPALVHDVNQFKDILQLCSTRGLLDLDQSGIAIATEWAASLEEAAHLFPPDKRPAILEVDVSCLTLPLSMSQLDYFHVWMISFRPARGCTFCPSIYFTPTTLPSHSVMHTYHGHP